MEGKGFNQEIAGETPNQVGFFRELVVKETYKFNFSCPQISPILENKWMFLSKLTFWYIILLSGSLIINFLFYLITTTSYCHQFLSYLENCMVKLVWCNLHLLKNLRGQTEAWCLYKLLWWIVYVFCWEHDYYQVE